MPRAGQAWLIRWYFPYPHARYSTLGSKEYLVRQPSTIHLVFLESYSTIGPSYENRCSDDAAFHHY